MKALVDTVQLLVQKANSFRRNEEHKKALQLAEKGLKLLKQCPDKNVSIEFELHFVKGTSLWNEGEIVSAFVEFSSCISLAENTRVNGQNESAPIIILLQFRIIIGVNYFEH